jgi:hypothetical protein
MSIEAITGIQQNDWYAICDICAMRFFGSTMLVNYRNEFVCTQCFEHRHPQEFIPPVRTDKMAPPISRPDVDEGTKLPLAQPPYIATTTSQIYGEEN